LIRRCACCRRRAADSTQGARKRRSCLACTAVRRSRVIVAARWSVPFVRQPRPHLRGPAPLIAVSAAPAPTPSVAPPRTGSAVPYTAQRQLPAGSTSRRSDRQHPATSACGSCAVRRAPTVDGQFCTRTSVPGFGPRRSLRHARMVAKTPDGKMNGCSTEWWLRVQ